MRWVHVSRFLNELPDLSITSQWHLVLTADSDRAYPESLAKEDRECDVGERNLVTGVQLYDL